MASEPRRRLASALIPTRSAFTWASECISLLMLLLSGVESKLCIPPPTLAFHSLIVFTFSYYYYYYYYYILQMHRLLCCWCLVGCPGRDSLMGSPMSGCDVWIMFTVACFVCERGCGSGADDEWRYSMVSCSSLWFQVSNTIKILLWYRGIYVPVVDLELNLKVW